jgi:hypothetical protein
MARIKAANVEPLKCAYILCEKEFIPEFTGQAYCTTKCRNRMGVLRYFIKIIPDYLQTLSNDDLTRLLRRAGIRSSQRHSRFVIPDKRRLNNNGRFIFSRSSKIT